jgi:hypothetical protein
MTYSEFIQSKRHSSQEFGIAPDFIPDKMFPFQRHITEYMIRKGRCAGFIDTGLGKTLIQLTVAENYRKATGRPVLILTPLAVAFQFIKEAEKFGFSDIEYSRDGKFGSTIIVCNYERLDKFRAEDFECVILDESSILKNFDGAIKTQVTAFLRKVKYRFLFTATPSPNDFIELGTSSEALGYMGYTDMLGKFFSNKENNIKATDRIGSKFYLKPHAQDSFFEWVSSWSISMRKPSDHGFSDASHVLPNLNVHHHKVRNQNDHVVNGQILMFPVQSTRLTEVRDEQKQTITERCEEAVRIAQNETCVYWTNLNPEGDRIEEIDKDAVQIKGGMSIDKKEEILLAFSSGEIKRLITKPKITAFGLNWQHCHKTVYFPTFSYEQYYQAIRRFYRFGQQHDVDVHLVYSNGQMKVIESVMEKAAKADGLYHKLNTTTNQRSINTSKNFQHQIQLPSWT